MERGAYRKCGRTGAGAGRAGSRLRAVVAGVGLLAVLLPGVAQADAPQVETLAPGAIRFDRALLGGRVMAGGEATTYRVQYGETLAYGDSAPAAPADAGSGMTWDLRTQAVSGLEPATTYHYRVVASNGSGTVEGPDRTFRTPPAPRSGSERAYEQVSPVNKNGAPVYFGHEGQETRFPGAVSPDGERIVFMSWTNFSGAFGGGATSYGATRTDDGWVSTPISPPVRDPSGSAEAGFINVLTRTTPDLDSYVIETRDPVDADDANGYWDIFGRARAEQDFKLVTRGNDAERVSSDDHNSIAVADDGHAVLFQTKSELVPGSSVPGTYQLYLRKRGQTLHVSTLPNGDPVAAAGAYDGKSTYDQTNVLAALSDDGSRVTFAANGQIYQWTEGGGTRWLSEPRDGLPSPGGEMTWIRSSRDGARVLFFSPGPLTDDAPAEGGFYEYSSEGSAEGELRFRGSGIDTAGGDFVVWSVASLSASEDLSSIFYEVVRFEGADVRSELRRLTADGMTTVARSGANEFDVIDFVSGRLTDGFHMSPDGRGVLFQSKLNLTAYDSGGRRMTYAYNDDAGLQCLTCRPDGRPPLGSSKFTSAKSSLITDDGSRALFAAIDPLVGSDVNNRYDVYEWHDGEVSLLSSGRSPDDSYLVGISASGLDAVFATAESLVWQDVDGGDLDFYDARIGGGFGPEPPRPPAPCAGDACQGLPPASPPAGGKSGTEAFRGAGNLSPAAVRVARVKAVTGGVARLRVRVSGAGRVSVSGASVRGRSRKTSKAGRVDLRVALTANARRALQRRGKVVAPVRISFRSADGDAVTRSLSVTFKRSGNGGRR